MEHQYSVRPCARQRGHHGLDKQVLCIVRAHHLVGETEELNRSIKISTVGFMADW